MGGLVAVDMSVTILCSQPPVQPSFKFNAHVLESYKKGEPCLTDCREADIVDDCCTHRPLQTRMQLLDYRQLVGVSGWMWFVMMVIVVIDGYTPHIFGIEQLWKMLNTEVALVCALVCCCYLGWLLGILLALLRAIERAIDYVNGL